MKDREAFGYILPMGTDRWRLTLAEEVRLVRGNERDPARLSAKSLGLLAMLAVAHPEPVSRETLARHL